MIMSPDRISKAPERSSTPQMRPARRPRDARRTVEYWIARVSPRSRPIRTLRARAEAAVEGPACTAQGHRPSLLHWFPRGRRRRHRRSRTRPLRRHGIRPGKKPALPRRGLCRRAPSDPTSPPGSQDMIRDLSRIMSPSRRPYRSSRPSCSNRAPPTQMLDAMRPTRAKTTWSGTRDHRAPPTPRPAPLKTTRVRTRIRQRGGLLLAGLIPPDTAA